MDTEQLLRLGANHIAARRYIDAERSFRAILATEPDNPHALNGLGLALHELGQLAEACRVLERAIERAPDLTEAHFNLGRVHVEREELDRALACFEEVLCRVPADADVFAMIAIALERSGEFDEAADYFSEAARFSDTYQVAAMLRFSAGFLREIETLVRPAPVPDTILQSHPGAAHDAVVLVACDSRYLRKYGPAFVNSFACHAGPATLLHLHVLDPDGAIDTEIRELLGRTGTGRYLVSAEHGGRFLPGSRAQAVWYTCARFLHLETWLRGYAAPVVVLDVDAALQAPLSRLLDQVGDGDIGLNLRQPRRAPWLDAVANVFVARPTPAASRYLRLVAAYAEYFLVHDAPQWHLDQCALYCTLRMLEAAGRAPDARPITDAAESTLFHLGHSYDERMADARYARYATER